MADSHVKWLCAVKGTDTDSETFMRAVCAALEAFAEYGVGEVGGDWPTLSEFRVVASAGSYLQVSLPSAGKGIRVDYDFAGGEAVVIDCQGETVLINDVDARDCVALASDFFALEPGDCIVSTSNCTYVETRFSERWA